MAPTEIYVCQCPICQKKVEHPEKERHRQMNVFLSRLDEQQRRWYVALEAKQIGHGGIRQMSLVTGLAEHTIIRGQKELAALLEDRPHDRARLPGGGRHAIEKKDASITTTLVALLESETAGDPMGDSKWTRSSLRQLSRRLSEAGYEASAPTVSRLLKQLGYSLKGNVKEKEAAKSHPNRDEQFQHIEKKKQEFRESGQPMI